MRRARRPVAGRTIELRIPISRFDGENERWRNSGARNRYRSSFRPKLQSTTILTRNVTFTSSKSTDRPSLPTGVKLPPDLGAIMFSKICLFCSDKTSWRFRLKISRPRAFSHSLGPSRTSYKIPLEEAKRVLADFTHWSPPATRRIHAVKLLTKDLTAGIVSRDSSSTIERSRPSPFNARAAQPRYLSTNSSRVIGFPGLPRTIFTCRVKV